MKVTFLVCVSVPEHNNNLRSNEHQKQITKSWPSVRGGKGGVIPYSRLIVKRPFSPNYFGGLCCEMMYRSTKVSNLKADKRKSADHTWRTQLLTIIRNSKKLHRKRILATSQVVAESKWSAAKHWKDLQHNRRCTHGGLYCQCNQPAAPIWFQTVTCEKNDINWKEARSFCNIWCMESLCSLQSSVLSCKWRWRWQKTTNENFPSMQKFFHFFQNLRSIEQAFQFVLFHCFHFCTKGKWSEFKSENWFSLFQMI